LVRAENRLRRKLGYLAAGHAQRVSATLAGQFDLGILHCLDLAKRTEGGFRKLGKGLLPLVVRVDAKAYLRYYHEDRIHDSLDKDAPTPRPIERRNAAQTRGHASRRRIAPSVYLEHSRLRLLECHSVSDFDWVFPSFWFHCGGPAELRCSFAAIIVRRSGTATSLLTLLGSIQLDAILATDKCLSICPRFQCGKSMVGAKIYVSSAGRQNERGVSLEGELPP
jgi:hypothetical protein